MPPTNVTAPTTPNTAPMVARSAGRTWAEPARAGCSRARLAPTAAGTGAPARDAAPTMRTAPTTSVAEAGPRGEDRRDHGGHDGGHADEQRATEDVSRAEPHPHIRIQPARQSDREAGREEHGRDRGDHDGHRDGQQVGERDAPDQVPRPHAHAPQRRHRVGSGVGGAEEGLPDEHDRGDEHGGREQQETGALETGRVLDPLDVVVEVLDGEVLAVARERCPRGRRGRRRRRCAGARPRSGSRG